MKRLAILFFLFWPLNLAAQDLPTLFDVHGVATNDALNVRERPTSKAPIIGRLHPNAKHVEVVQRSADGSWGMVNLGEETGWAYMKFLRLHPGQTDDLLASPLTCHGTEPFWNLKTSPRRSEFSVMGEAAQSFSIMSRSRSANSRGSFGLIANYPAGSMAIALMRQTCSDGMSDRTYGIAIEALLNKPTGLTQYSGCCTIAR